MFWKKIYFLMFLVISQEAFASEIKGEMICKISNQNIIQMKDGKAHKFTSYENDLRVGDSFSFGYKFEPEMYASSKSHGHLNFYIKGGPRYSLFDTEIYYGIENINWAASIENKRLFIHYEYDTIDLDLASSLKFFRYADINPNSINLKLGNGEVSMVLKRYYKSDWSGLIVTSSPTELHHATFSCQHRTESAWDELINSSLSQLR